MNRIIHFSIVLLVAGLLTGQGRLMGATVLWQNDFQSGLGVLGTNTELLTTVVNDPAGVAGNMVLRVDDSAKVSEAGTQWGELRPLPHGLAIGDAVAGVDTFTLTVKYYIPVDTTGNATDNLRFYIRWGTDDSYNPGSGRDNGASSSVSIANAAKGSWQTLTYTAVINANATHLFPIISVTDDASYGGSGTILYLDDIMFTVTPEPGKAVLLLAGMSTMLLRRRRV